MARAGFWQSNTYYIGDQSYNYGFQRTSISSSQISCNANNCTYSIKYSAMRLEVLVSGQQYICEVATLNGATATPQLHWHTVNQSTGIWVEFFDWYTSGTVGTGYQLTMQHAANGRSSDCWPYLWYRGAFMEAGIGPGMATWALNNWGH